MEKNVHEIEIKLNNEWEKCLDDAFKKKVKEVKVDGFRKGSCPKDVYIKKFGIESLYMDAVDEAVSIGYKKVLEDNKLNPIIEPKVDVKNINEKEITFTFTIITKPEITLGEYKNLGIKKEKAKVTKEEIENEIKKLQDQMADLVIKEEGIIASGDTAIIDFKGTVDGAPLEGGSAENFSLEIGSNSFIPGFEEGLIGHKTGETVTLNLKFPKDYVENLKDKDVTFEVKINEVKVRVLPEINEDFFKDLGYDDIKTKEELEEKIKKDLLSGKEAKIADEHLDKCLDKACENMKVTINDEIVDDEIHRMIHQYEEQLKMQGLDLNKYFELTGDNEEGLHNKMHDEALKRVKYRFLIEEVAKNEKIDFTKEEVEAKAKEMAENYGISVDELIKAYGTIDIVKYDMTMHKALEIIKENN